MIIDVHAHVGDWRRTKDDSRVPMTWDLLLWRLDDEGLDRAVVLPAFGASPEGALYGLCVTPGNSTADLVLGAARYPDRLIPFGCLDPRWGPNRPDTDFSEVLDWLIEQGARGVGEIMAKLPFDDPRVVNLFRQAGEKGLPVLLHNGAFGAVTYGLEDEPGCPRLERLLQAVPETTVIAHGPGFWSEIGPPPPPELKSGYPKGSFTGEGAVARLLRRYPNLYADISACSCFRAFCRNPEYAARFLNEFQDKAILGTDIFSRNPARAEEERANVQRLVESVVEGRPDEEAFGRVYWHEGLMPQLPYLQALRDRGHLTDAAYHKIAGGNAARLLGLG
ncbi:MAG: amidohydrolase family protein [Anaerolineae bacterium]